LPVATGLQPPERRVDRCDLLSGLFEQRGRMLTLERQRRALRVVLVVGPARARGLGEVRELPPQRGHPPERARPLGQQQLARVRHPPDHSRWLDLSRPK
jgi:hypothetical protein